MGAAVFVRLLFWLWFAGAIALGHFRVLTRLPVFGLPAIVLGLTALLLAAYFRIRPLRAWVDGLNVRSLVLVHVTRFIGIYFLILFQRGELPRAFAVPAGMGDIVIATMALPVALAPIEATARLRAIVIWNVVGLVDLLLILFTAVRINLSAPLHLLPLMQLPLSLVPTLLVPLWLATHVIIFVRAVNERPSSRQP
jgi:hypothetical protein